MYNSSITQGVEHLGIELELKFRATPEKLEVLRNTVLGIEEVYAMETTYYDTPDNALSKRHWTLRRRLENKRSVCTLKTPASTVGRNEFEVDSPDIFLALPELCKLSGLSELLTLTSTGLLPICGARFTRVSKTVQEKDCVVYLALDQGILTGGKKELPLCEAEIELKEGSWAAACIYAKQLAATYGLEQETSSKFRRALALSRGEHYG